MKENIEFKDYFVGQKFKATIQNVETEGKIQIDDYRVYLCQNKKSGAPCANRLGYKYSWSIGKATKQDLLHSDVEFLYLEEKQPDLILIPIIV